MYIVFCSYLQALQLIVLYIIGRRIGDAMIQLTLEFAQIATVFPAKSTKTKCKFRFRFLLLNRTESVHYLITKALVNYDAGDH